MIQVAPHKNVDSIIIFVSASCFGNFNQHDNEKKTLGESIFLKIEQLRINSWSETMKTSLELRHEAYIQRDGVKQMTKIH